MINRSSLVERIGPHPSKIPPGSVKPEEEMKMLDFKEEFSAWKKHLNGKPICYEDLFVVLLNYNCSCDYNEQIGTDIDGVDILDRYNSGMGSEELYKSAWDRAVLEHPERAAKALREDMESNKLYTFESWLQMFVSDYGFDDTSTADEIAAYVEQETRNEWAHEQENREKDPDSDELLIDLFDSADDAASYFVGLFHQNLI